jgi:hypothetical protein
VGASPRSGGVEVTIGINMKQIKKNEPTFLFDDEGNKVGVLLRKADFEKIMEELEDYTDYKMIIERSGKKYKTYTREEVIAEFEQREK